MGSGYRKIVDFITSYGTVTAVGVEGTGSYGAELARTLRGEGLTVLEVNRPNRAARRLKGKVRSAGRLRSRQVGTRRPDDSRSRRPRTGPLNACGSSRSGRASALKARTAAINQIKGAPRFSPGQIRAKYRALATSSADSCPAAHETFGHMADPEYVTLLTLKALGSPMPVLATEIAAADAALKEILDAYAPMLCDLPGVGTDVASQLLITVGDNPDRSGERGPVRFTRRRRPGASLIRQDNPPPAQQGRGPQRQSCLAIRLSWSGMGSCQRTKEYVAKRTVGGQEQTRNHALPQTLRSPGDLPSDHQPPGRTRQLRPPPHRTSTRLHHNDRQPANLVNGFPSFRLLERGHPPQRCPRNAPTGNG